MGLSTSFPREGKEIEDDVYCVVEGKAGPWVRDRETQFLGSFFPDIQFYVNNSEAKPDSFRI